MGSIPLNLLAQESGTKTKNNGGKGPKLGAIFKYCSYILRKLLQQQV